MIIEQYLKQFTCEAEIPSYKCTVVDFGCYVTLYCIINHTTDDTTEEESSTADQDLDRHDAVTSSEGPALLSNETMLDIPEMPVKQEPDEEESEVTPPCDALSQY